MRSDLFGREALDVGLKCFLIVREVENHD
jgi:hypothetical protein